MMQNTRSPAIHGGKGCQRRALPYQYVHPTPLIDVSALAPPDDAWGIFGYHHMQLYAQAVAR